MLSFPYKLVTFDVTGTLLKPRSVSKTYAEFAARCGISAEPADLEKGFKIAYKKLAAKHPNFGLESGLGWRAWWASVVKETFKSAVPPDRFPSDSERVDSVADELIEHYSKGSSWITKPHSTEVLRSLKSSSVHIGVISNFDPRLHRVLRENGLSEFFSFVVTSHEAKTQKPDVNIFRYASEAYGKHTGFTLNVEQALHIGDSYQLDYLGARNAGWDSWLVNSKKIDAPVDFLIFPSMAELREHLIKFR